MRRWDILGNDRMRGTEVPIPREERSQNSNDSSVSVGRGPSEISSAKPPERPETPRESRRSRTPTRRMEHRDSWRTYSLRNSELAAMADIGRFRTVDVQDLGRFVYGGSEARANYDIEKLRTAGLVEKKTLFRAHRAPRRIVALTKQGRRVLRKASGLRKDQAVYYGYVKAREIDHDADLYKVYQQAAEEIRNRGGRPVTIRLDFELKGALQRARNAMKSLPEGERRTRLEGFAKEHGLTITGTRIQVPDVQVEYETRDGELERTNLELISENYRTKGIRSKAASGFAIYARSGDTARVRRALQDTHAVERILSI